MTPLLVITSKHKAPLVHRSTLVYPLGTMLDRPTSLVVVISESLIPTLVVESDREIDDMIIDLIV